MAPFVLTCQGSDRNPVLQFKVNQNVKIAKVEKEYAKRANAVTGCIELWTTSDQPFRLVGKVADTGLTSDTTLKVKGLEICANSSYVPVDTTQAMQTVPVWCAKTTTVLQLKDYMTEKWGGENGIGAGPSVLTIKCAILTEALKSMWSRSLAELLSKYGAPACSAIIGGMAGHEFVRFLFDDAADASGSEVALDSKLGDIAASAGNTKTLNCLLKASSFTLVLHECGVNTRMLSLDDPLIERIQAKRAQLALPELEAQQLEVGDVMGNIFDEATLATPFRSIQPGVLGNIVVVRAKVLLPAAIQMHINIMEAVPEEAPQDLAAEAEPTPEGGYDKSGNNQSKTKINANERAVLAVLPVDNAGKGLYITMASIRAQPEADAALTRSGRNALVNLCKRKLVDVDKSEGRGCYKYRASEEGVALMSG